MHTERTALKQTISINKLISLYYFEYGKDFVFPGESHDYWEILYIDKGEVDVVTDTKRHHLKSGMAIFHKPHEFHSIYANHGKAPNLVVITFDCNSRKMKLFENLVIQLDDEERDLLAKVIEEGKNAFVFPFKYPLKKYRHQNPPIGSEQLLNLYLECFLIVLLRRMSKSLKNTTPSFSITKNRRDEVTRRTIDYMEARMHTSISIPEICSTLHISQTRLKENFKQNTGFSVLEYFARMKIEKAKLFIREDASNFTEISEKLGFSSVHYFSKTFKKATGMSPSEYASSIKARVERSLKRLQEQEKNEFI